MNPNLLRHPKAPSALTMQQRMDFDKTDWLTQCRETGKQLLRSGGTITSEDILVLCPRPTYLHRNTVGRIFDKDFKPVGFVKAKHKAAKGRWIRTWELR